MSRARERSGASLCALSAADRKIAWLVFAALTACYLLTYTGSIQSSDGLAMFSTTESLVRRGDADSNQLLWMGLQQGSFGANGDLFSRKGLGMSLLALPLAWVARLWPAIGLVQASLLLNPLLTAGTGALIYVAGRRLGWRPATATLTALTFGLLTPAWPYTQDFFSDPVTAGGTFLAIYGLLAYRQTERRAHLWLAGTGWGVAYLARTLHLITLPVFALALAAILTVLGTTVPRWDLRSGLVEWLGATGQQQLRQRKAWIAFGMPVLLAGVFSLAWNWLRFGSLFESGYLAEESFSGVWWFGVWGLLVGPARGLLWYSPILLLGLAGARWFWRQSRWLLVLILAVTVLYVLVYGKWFMWHGGYSWGPRFLVAVLPGLALLTGPGWEKALDPGGAIWRWTAVLLAAASLAVNGLGLALPYSLVQDDLARTVQPLFAPETFARWTYSPLVMQWRYLRPENIHVAWWRAGDLPGVALLLLAVVAGGWLLLRSARKPEKGVRERSVVLVGLVVGLAALLVIARYQTTLSGAGNQDTAARIHALERTGDAIVHLKPEETQQFANTYHGRLPTYGFAPQGELNETDRAWLDRIGGSHARVWIVSEDGPAGASAWERALLADGYSLLEENAGPDEGRRRLALYAVRSGAPEATSGEPVRLTPANGEPALIRLSGYSFDKESSPGGDLLLTLRWQAERPIGQNYKVFAHLLDESGQKVAQRDGEPVAWTRPTTTWQPSEEIVDRHGFLLPADLPSGRYTLSVGLYDPATGQRLLAEGDLRDAITLGEVDVGPSH